MRHAHHFWQKSFFYFYLFFKISKTPLFTIFRISHEICDFHISLSLAVSPSRTIAYSCNCLVSGFFLLLIQQTWLHTNAEFIERVADAGLNPNQQANKGLLWLRCEAARGNLHDRDSGFGDYLDLNGSMVDFVQGSRPVWSLLSDWVA